MGWWVGWERGVEYVRVRFGKRGGGAKETDWIARFSE